MFTEYINRVLESERGLVSNRQEENIKAVPDVTEEKTATEIKIPKKYQNDIETFREIYGENFKTGLCIDLTLKEALEIIPRERKRTDAYTGLVSYLSKELGIKLTIKSQKSKLWKTILLQIKKSSILQ